MAEKDQTLQAALQAACLRHGQREAFRFPERSLSFAELDDAAGRCAAGLAALGARPRERVAIMAPTCPELLVAHLGVQWLGGVRVPLNPGLTGDELAFLLRDAAPAAAIVGEPQSAAHGALLQSLGIRCVVIGAAAPPDPSFAELLSRAAPAPPVHQGRADEPALLFYTSGTTGRPKGALLSHRNVLSGVERLINAWRWSGDDRFLLALPLFHVHGLGVGVHGALLTGCLTIVRPRFRAAEDLACLARERCTLFMGVPAMYYDLVHLPDDQARDLGRMRLFISGSAALPITTFAAFEKRYGHRILERYGATETMLTISNPYDGERRPGSIGLPLPGVEVRVVDEAWRDVPNGTPGELLIRSESVFLGYHNLPEATAEAVRDGWFASGDIGLREPDGYLRILDRKKNLVISGGFNIYPAEVENVLRRHAGVRDAAVVGLPDERLGEVVAALVVPSESAATAEELLTFCGAHLARYKQPRRLHFAPDLPRNAMGKVDARAVRRLLAEEVSRQA
ncbi:MAG: AMP-binding protein [Candidatus Tectomicrobia bacterium]|nr:AMP-binding protein [Candidatus Tectomicrobia bacterium]